MKKIGRRTILAVKIRAAVSYSQNCITIAKKYRKLDFLFKAILTSKGANINILWGNTEMGEAELLANLKELISNLSDVIPRGIKNVKALCLQVRQI